MRYQHTIRGITYSFDSLRALLAKASPPRSGDELAGIAAANAIERVAAQMALADLPLAVFLNEAVVPYEDDEVTRLILDMHDRETFVPLAGLTVGELRNWLLAEETTGEVLAGIAAAFTPEMVAAVSRLMRLQDLVLVARKVRVVTRFRTTVGLPGTLCSRL